MPSPELLKALHIYSTCFQKHLEIAPIMWNISTKRFYYVSSLSQLSEWVWNMFGLLAFSGVGSVVFVLLRELVVETKTIPLFNVLGLVLMGIVGLTMIGIAIAVMIYGREFAHGWNEVHRMEEQLCTRGKFLSINLSIG